MLRYQFFLLLAVVTFCSFLSGCCGSVPAQVAPPKEEATLAVSFLHDHAAGLEMASQEKKPALIFFSLPGNAGSQRMLETTFCAPEIMRLAEWLVCIHVDGLRESALCESLGISSFPTIILANADGSEVRRLTGRQTPDQLAVQIHMLFQVTAQRPQSVVGR